MGGINGEMKQRLLGWWERERRGFGIRHTRGLL
jgi:hypothetical protein